MTDPRTGTILATKPRRESIHWTAYLAGVLAIVGVIALGSWE